MFTLDIDHFDLAQISDSGQCFRMNRLPNRRYSVVSGSRYLELSQEGRLVTFYCSGEDLPFWKQYFDLETDYGAFLASVKKRDRYLQNAAEAGSGIRILRQDLWEMILTFIISQQKTIPKIREAVECLSRSYGTEHTVILPEQWETRTYYSFPDAASLCRASLEDLKELKLGYRAKYIYQVCRDCAEGRLDLSHLSALHYEEAMSYLTGFYGIGLKVANCICLFGLHHIEAFPVDTWIEQILMSHYYKKKYDSLPKSRLFQTIIQDNFKSYKGYAGVMQQYIFFYERLSKNRILTGETYSKPSEKS